MDETYLWLRLYQGLVVIWVWLAALVILTGIRVYQNVRTNRLLSSIDQSLKMLPGVNRELKRVA